MLLINQVPVLLQSLSMSKVIFNKPRAAEGLCANQPSTTITGKEFLTLY